MLIPEKLLKNVEPFKNLPEKEIEFLAKKLKAEVVKRDTEIIREGQKLKELLVIVKGSCIVKKGDKIVDILEKGDTFGALAILLDEHSSFSVKAVEDTILYTLPAETLIKLTEEYPDFKEFFTRTTIERLSEGYRKLSAVAEDSVSLLPVSKLRLTPVVFCNAEETSKQVAKRMVEANTSCCIVKGNPNGIITDKDLKERVVASGKNPEEVKAKDIATYPVLTIKGDAFVFEAILKMINNNIKRLPVVENGKIIGILEDRTIFIQQSRNFVFLAKEIETEKDIKALKRLFLSVEEAIEPLFSTGKDITILQRFISEINDRFIRKALDLSIEEIGPPPSPYVFLVLGSEGRREQAIKTDIDNAILFENENSREYFIKLGKRVTEKLLSIGFPECPGKVMTSNPEWVKSQREWNFTLEEWFSRPEANNLLKASIFLDFRGVHGNTALAKELRKRINELARNYRNFLVAMVYKVLEVEPPLSFFQKFILEKSGEHKGELDLKRGGIFPITQGVRVLALEHGIEETNTIERLKLLKSKIGKDFSEELIESFKFLQSLRLKTQLDKIKRGLKPDNYVNPNALTKFERDLLKDAFKVVSRFQELLGVHFRLRV